MKLKEKKDVQSQKLFLDNINEVDLENWLRSRGIE